MRSGEHAWVVRSLCLGAVVITGALLLGQAAADGPADAAVEEEEKYNPNDVETRVYDTRWLVEPVPDFMAPVRRFAISDPDSSHGATDGFGLIGIPRGREQQADELIGIITDTVGQPDEWKCFGGPSDARMLSGHLILRTTERNHAEVERLLKMLFGGQGRHMCVEAWWVDAPMAVLPTMERKDVVVLDREKASQLLQLVESPDKSDVRVLAAARGVSLNWQQSYVLATNGSKQGCECHHRQDGHSAAPSPSAPEDTTGGHAANADGAAKQPPAPPCLSRHDEYMLLSYRASWVPQFNGCSATIGIRCAAKTSDAEAAPRGTFETRTSIAVPDGGVVAFLGAVDGHQRGEEVSPVARLVLVRISRVPVTKADGDVGEARVGRKR